jgi:hypothetical protein
MLSPKFKSLLDENRKEATSFTEFTAYKQNIFRNPLLQEVSEEDSSVKPIFKNIVKRVKTPNAETKFASIVTTLMSKRDNQSSFRQVIDEKFKHSFNTLLVDSSSNFLRN